MGLFMQKPEEENAWAALPGEPREAKDAADTLEVAAALDPLDIGLGAQTTSIVFPIAPVLEEASEQTDAEPKD